MITSTDLATEALKERVEHNLFYKLLTQVNSSIQRYKAKRKLEQKTQLVTDPAR